MNRIAVLTTPIPPSQLPAECTGRKLRRIPPSSATANSALTAYAAPCAEDVPQPVFAALPIPQSKLAAVTVWIGNHAVDIQNGADGAVVEQVLKVVSRL